MRACAKNLHAEEEWDMWDLDDGDDGTPSVSGEVMGIERPILQSALGTVHHSARSLESVFAAAATTLSRNNHVDLLLTLI